MSTTTASQFLSDPRSRRHKGGWRTTDSTSKAQPVHYRTAAVGRVDVFYCEAGPTGARRASVARLPHIFADIPGPDPAPVRYLYHALPTGHFALEDKGLRSPR